MYGNLAALSRGLSLVPRESVFVTSKLQPSDMGEAAMTRAMADTLSHWEYIDLLLIHWPGGGTPLRQETWRAMERYVEQGKVRSLGVSNFLPHHIESLDEVASVPICVNQIEYHPL
jgi:diketogulonate reductase-like aldo/keto reductase